MSIRSLLLRSLAAAIAVTCVLAAPVPAFAADEPPSIAATYELEWRQTFHQTYSHATGADPAHGLVASSVDIDESISYSGTATVEVSNERTTVVKSAVHANWNEHDVRRSEYDDGGECSPSDRVRAIADERNITTVNPDEHAHDAAPDGLITIGLQSGSGGTVQIAYPVGYQQAGTDPRRWMSNWATTHTSVTCEGGGGSSTENSQSADYISWPWAPEQVPHGTFGDLVSTDNGNTFSFHGAPPTFLHPSGYLRTYTTDITMTRKGHHYIVELRDWIPFAAIVDPGQPVRLPFRSTLEGPYEILSPNCWTPPVDKWNRTIVESAFRGDGADGAGYRIRRVIEFDFDGKAITNLTDMPIAQPVGTTYRDKKYIDLITGAVVHRCSESGVATQQRTLTKESATTFAADMSGSNPLVPGAPSIDNDVRIAAHADMSLTVEHTVTQFPSASAVVQYDGERVFAASVSAACVDPVTGAAGALKIARGLTSHSTLTYEVKPEPGQIYSQDSSLCGR